MKRIGTVFIIFLSFIAVSARAQVNPALRTSSMNLLTKKAQSAQWHVGAIPSTDPRKGDEILSTFKTEGISYMQDTSGGNWWVYAPILNRSTGDSEGYFHFNSFPDGELIYFTNDDTIGSLDIDTNANPSDPPYVAFDTMYNRVMAIRVSPPKDLGSTVHLDSVNLIFYPESMSSRDEIRFWAVQVSDDPGGYPFPDLISQTAIAEATIPASKITVGQMNSLTVSLGGKTLTTINEKNEIAICVFVDGPDFPSDTIGYFLEADPNAEITTAFSPDTDASAQLVQGPDSSIPMRTYLLGLDAGNLSIAGNPPNYVGGGGSFFVNTTQVDQTGAQTGNAFDGNVGITTYFHGTALAGVSQTGTNDYNLEQSYPNPVATTSDISYNLATSGPVTLKVYNALGEEVETVVNGSIEGAGPHSATFNAGTLPDGMYYYKLQSGEFTATQSLVIAR